MKVKLIYANTYGFSAENVYRALKTNKNGRSIVIVPDNFTLSIEKNILKKLGTEASFDIEVVSFMRLAQKTLKGRIGKCLTPEGSVMLLKRAADGIRNELSVYDKTTDVGFSRELYAVVTSLRNSGITPKDLLSAFGKGDKLYDVGLIYDNYLKILGNSFVDGSSRLEAFSDFLSESDLFKDSDIFVFGFSDFTAVQYEILSRLFVGARSVTVSIVVAGKDAKNKRIVPSRAAGKLPEICTAAGIEPEIVIAEESLPPYKKQLLDYTFSYAYPSPAEVGDALSIVRAGSVYDEVDFIARSIRKAVVNGARYKDFALVIPDTKTYENDVKNIFSRYDIPYFLNKKVVFSQQAAAKFILSAVKCANDEFTFASVLPLVKNPFFYKDEKGFSEVCLFENHCVENSLTDKPKKSRYDETSEKVLQKVFAICAPFRNLEGKNAAAFVDALDEFLSATGIEEECERIAASADTAEGRAAGQFYEKITAVTDEMRRIFPADATFSAKEFHDVLKGVFENVKIALVPMYLDCVFVGAADESFYDDVRTMFVAGALEGVVPSQTRGTAVVNLKDEETLKNKGLGIFPDKRETAKTKCFELVQIFLKHKDKLIISYPDFYNGSACAPAAFTTQFFKMFTKNGKPLSAIRCDGADLAYGKDRTDDFAYRIGTTKNGKYKLLSDRKPEDAVYRNSFYETLTDGDKREIEKLVLPDDGKKPEVKGNKALLRGVFSASQLECYFACPYMQFFRYGLGLKPRKDGSLTTLETGTILHEIMRAFTEEKAYLAPSDENMEKLCSRVIADILKRPDYRRFDNPRNRATLSRIKKEGVRICRSIADEIAQSDFKPLFSEAKIGKKADGAVFDGLTVNVSGREYRLVGSIDRIDSYKGYFTVIDYKSFQKDLSVSDVYNGSKIQPVLYMTAVGDDELKYPAGILYQPITFGYKKDAGRFRMKGFVLDDPKVLAELDNALQGGGKSEFFPVSFTSDGRPRRSKSVIADIDFTALSVYAKKLANRALCEIADGNVNPAPLPNACKTCDFKYICPYENEERFIRDDFPRLTISDLMTLAGGGCVTAAEEEEEKTDE